MTQQDQSSKSSSLSQFERFYPWAVIILCAAFLFYKYIMQVSPSIMSNELMQAFHVHGAGLGNLAATFFYSYFIMQIFVGIVLDRASTRVLSALAILISALGTLLFSISHELWLAGLSRALMGVGAAFATVTYMKLAAVWFHPKKYAFIGGLLATAAMVGAIFGEAPLAWLTASEGWRESLMLCGWLGVVLAILFFCVVRDHPEGNQLVYHQTNHKISFKDVWQVIRKPQNWILTLYSGLSFSPVAVFGGLWGNPFIQQAYQLNNTKSASLISLTFFGLAIGGPLLGYISDYFCNRRLVMLCGSLTSLVSIIITIYTPNLPLWILGLLLFLFGLGTGAFMLGFAIGKEINPISVAATVIALINTGDAIFGAITEPLVGKFLDLGWQHHLKHGIPLFSIHDFKMAFIILPAYLIVALLLVFFIKESGKKMSGDT